jgi:hypothetical protein
MFFDDWAPQDPDVVDLHLHYVAVLHVFLGAICTISRLILLA